MTPRVYLILSILTLSSLSCTEQQESRKYLEEEAFTQKGQFRFGQFL